MKTRLAPSPTGAQHMGNARTYLINWLFARQQHAEVCLRIEDIDSPRVKQGAAAGILEDFQWLGLDWDGTPTIQSQRIELYQDYFRQLQQKELVYPCTCSRTDIAQAASAPHLENEGPVYPGTCQHRTVADAKNLQQPFAWRFRVAHSPVVHDRFVGDYPSNISQVGGDFVVWKADGTPAYQLAVVVDDITMNITDVVRGDDLLISTGRQLLLYEAFQSPPPRWYHVPLVIGPDGRRLAKRHGDTRLSALRAAQVSVEKFLGYLAWSCGWLPEINGISLIDLLPRFSWHTIPRMAWICQPDDLAKIGYSAGVS
ncbi:MAG: tRNA glutamyl-Q(34) synthetase GluQRS [Zavarzinella sp.]